MTDARNDQRERLKRDLLRNMNDLPPMPDVVLRAQQVAVDPAAGIPELAAVLEADQALATRVLKLANSAYYGLPRKVSAINHACTMLGQRKLVEIVRMAAMAKILNPSLESYGLARGNLWWHSVAVAVGSGVVARQTHPALADDAFTAGLVHDAGKILLDPLLRGHTAAISELRAASLPVVAIEQELLGIDHAEIGAEMINFWNIPESIASAVRRHHEPSAEGTEARPLAHIVHLADHVAHITDDIALMSGIDEGVDASRHTLDEVTPAYLNLTDRDLNVLLTTIVEAVHRIELEIQSGP